MERKAFLYSVDDFDRNISDADIINAFELGGSLVKCYTIDEFAELINDDFFNDMEWWVRFIMY